MANFRKNTRYKSKSIAIIDADLLGRTKHRFPNLVCEKLSAYHKNKGDSVTLKLDYENLDDFDKVYVCKVFTDTFFPDHVLEHKNIEVGGTGFYFDKAPPLPDEIEHTCPDYHLYDNWIAAEVEKGEKNALAAGKKFKKSSFMVQFKEYTDYCIGFLSRGCFRKCLFCVNQKYDHVFIHSPLKEFYTEDCKKICLLDDNFLGSPKWKELLDELLATKKPFKFKQGLDERLLTNEKCKLLFSANYDGDYTFAFDKPQDYKLIESKLKMIRRYSKTINIKFYVLCGFESTDENDIENVFIRIELLMRYKCLPYIMRYRNKNDTPWKRSPYKDMYVTLARWCNQPNIFKKMSFRQFCEANQKNHKTKGSLCSAMKACANFEAKFPEIAKLYFDLKYADFEI